MYREDGVINEAILKGWNQSTLHDRQRKEEMERGGDGKRRRWRGASSRAGKRVVGEEGGGGSQNLRFLADLPISSLFGDKRN